MTVTLDDLETDFDGALAALYDECAAIVEAIPEAERETFFLQGRAEHLVFVLKHGAPDFLVQRAEEGLLRRLLARRRERRQSAGMKST